MFVSLRFADAYEGAEPVVYLRPVDQGDVAIEQALGKVLAGEYAPIVPEVGAVTPGEEGLFVEDRAVAGLQGIGVDVRPGELRARPEARPVAAPEVVIFGLVYSVVLVRYVVERKAPAHRLLIQRVRVSWHRVGLPCLVLALRADCVLCTSQLQQVSELGRVENVSGVDGQRLAGLLVEKGNGPDEIPFACGRYGPMTEQNPQPASGAVGGEHPLQDGEGYTRLVAEATHRPASGIEIFPGAGFVREWVVAAVVRPDAIPKAAVARGATHVLAPGMLVRRDGLGGEVVADPIRLFGEDDLLAEAQGGQGAGYTPKPPPTTSMSVSASKGG